MAYIRCGGGGIPAALKTDMDSVFNKKFETSTTYPPNTWADTVNLMGVLPIRSASGTIANFPDGADTVPLKSLTYRFTPTQSGTGDPSPTNPRPITGVSSVNVTSAGKNLFDLNVLDVTGITIENGVATGTATSYHQAFRYGVPNLKFSDGQMTFTMSAYTNGNDSTSGTGLRVRIYYTDGTYSTLAFLNSDTTKTTKSVTTTAGKVIDYMTISYASTGSNIWHVSEVQLECGTTATTYEPYTAPTLTLVSLGQTVYGGEGNEAGVFVSKYGIVDLSTLNWTLNAGAHRAYCSDLASVIKIPTSGGETPTALAEQFKMVNYSASLQANQMTIYSDGRLIAYYDSDAPAGKLCYELATPATLSVDPVAISSRLGVNNIFLDLEGSECEVEYRADIDLLISSLNGNRGLMMATPSEPEEPENEENEIEEENER